MNKLVRCLFVQNFPRYVSAKYYLNWFTVGKVITKIKRVKLLLRRSVYEENVTGNAHSETNLS